MTDQNIDDLDINSSISSAILFMIIMLAINEIILGFLHRKKEQYSNIIKYFVPSMVTTLIGILINYTGIFAGFLLYQLPFQSSHKMLVACQSGFSQIFLIAFLPPIIFDSALTIKKKYFFENLGSVVLYAFSGTIISCVIIALSIWLIGFSGLISKFSIMEAFCFGSFISATDPVAVLAIFKNIKIDNNIYAIIYGESTINDAVCIVLFEAFVSFYKKVNQENPFQIISQFLFIFIFSILLGVLTGILCSYLLKQNYEVERDDQLNQRELTIMILIPWICYLLAQGLNLSGIASILFCGLIMDQYCIINMSKKGQNTIRKIYSVISQNFENLVFLFIGLSVFGYNIQFMELGIFMLLFTIFIIIFARFIQVTFNTCLINKQRDYKKLDCFYQFFLTYSGLRGAMAFALALESVRIFEINDAGRTMLTMTIFFTLFNILVQGPLLVYITEKYSSELCENQQMISINDDQDSNIQKKNSDKNETRIYKILKQALLNFDKFLTKHLIIDQSNVENQNSAVQSQDVTNQSFQNIHFIEQIQKNAQQDQDKNGQIFN